MKKELLIQRLLSGFCLTLISISLFAQNNGKITGKVVDSKGVALTGASVIVKGLNKGNSTDNDGLFSIENIPNGSYKLGISFVGYLSVELTVPVPQSSILNVSLNDDVNGLEEVIVTGVFDERKAINSSVAISTLSTKQIERLQPNSAADLLKNVPGVFVNSSAGEIRSTVYSRGISNRPSFNYDVSGMTYVSMQEDGLPVTNIGFNYWSPDLFLRADATTKRLEAVRGGSSAIVGANAPGGVFNYISKTGGKEFSGEVRAKFGLEGNGVNPYYRTDVNFGGPISKSGWSYNIGGFYRYADGARYAGYPLNYGGQIRANVEKKYKDGSITFFAKYLNDHNGTFMNILGQNFDNVSIANGVNGTDTYFLPSTSVLDYTIDGNKTIRHDPTVLNHIKDFTLGMNWKQTLGNGFSIQNNFRYGSKQLLNNSTSGVTSVTLDNLVANAVIGTLGVGTITYKDNITKQPLATVQAGLPPGWTVLNNNLPGQDILKNGFIYQASVYSDPKVTEFMDQFVLTKRFDKMSFNLGAFVGLSDVARYTQGVAGITYSTLQNRPQPLDVSYRNLLAGGIVQQITNPQGFLKTGGAFTMHDYQFKKTNVAPFFAHNWQINDKLTFDWGVRLENIVSEGSSFIRTVNDGKDGGLDKNPLTVYDNGYFKNPKEIPYSFTTTTFSFSGALNYVLKDNQSIYLRYSSGKKAPEFDLYMSIESEERKALTTADVQGIKQLELGYKIRTAKADITITPFYSLLDNVLQVSTALDDKTQLYNLQPYFNSIETKGIEIEGTINFSKNFNIRAVATLQSGVFKQFKFASEGPTTSKADDFTVDFSGNNVDTNPSVQFNITPTYNTNNFYAFLSWQYMGSRWANAPNAFELPAYSQFDLGTGYNLSKHLGLSVNINNLANTYGAMTWGAPGGFPTTYALSGFTPTVREKQKNAVFPLGTTQPRSFFVTATYKF